MGKPKKRKDSTVNFEWKGAAPINGINAYNFSIRWQGFVRAPFTGKYKFAVESNDSTLVTFNDKVIIALNMKTAAPESLNRNQVWLDSEVFLTQHPSVVRDKANSNEIFCIGGNKYKYKY
jgi:hypothetical protein